MKNRKIQQSRTHTRKYLLVSCKASRDDCELKPREGRDFDFRPDWFPDSERGIKRERERAVYVSHMRIDYAALVPKYCGQLLLPDPARFDALIELYVRGDRF